MGKEIHNTFWEIEHIVPERRYYVLFDTWEDIRTSMSVTGYDNLEDGLEEIKLLNELYANTKTPEKIFCEDGKYTYESRYRRKKFNYDYSDGSFFYGYALIDLQECTVIKAMNEFKYSRFLLGKNVKGANKDFFFRIDERIPKDYEWDEGEYDGWLQYRWGDGKNAIGYIETEKKKKVYRPKDKYFRKLDEEELSEIEYFNEGQTRESEQIEKEYELGR